MIEFKKTKTNLEDHILHNMDNIIKTQTILNTIKTLLHLLKSKEIYLLKMDSKSKYNHLKTLS